MSRAAPIGGTPSEKETAFISDLLGMAGDAAGRRVFVAIMAIDRFASLRYRIGYALAGRVVQDLAGRVRRAIAPVRLGRLGRTTIELAFLAADEEAAHRVLRDLQAAVEGSTEIDGQAMDLTITIGFADSAGAWRDGAELIEQAELALGQAQASHRKLALFSNKDNEDALERLVLMRDLRAAYDAGQLSLLYQPKLGARSGSVESVEALIRWEHPERGTVPPDLFIPLAEDLGEIRRLTEWTIGQAMEDRRRLLARGYPLVIYVNISGVLLADEGFSRWVLDMLPEGEGIGFEITETGVIADPAGALANLKAYAAAGIAIAIDDYGSGWSSLAYLKELPARELKIDRMFISGLASSHRDPLIVRSTIDLAHALEMQVTAEGVEDPTTFALLSVMGCDLVQGYIVARPLPVEELAAFLASLADVDAGPAARPWLKPVSLFKR